MESLTTIVKNTSAKLTYVCEGKVHYQIATTSHTYQLTLNSQSDEWKSTYLLPEFKSITLMRWIRRGIEHNDGSFIVVK